MSMEEFGDLFFVARDAGQKDFELLRHRANRSLLQKVGQISRVCQAALRMGNT